MIIHDYPLTDELIGFYRTAIEAMPDELLISGARKMPDLLKGLKQDKPNVLELRQRVMAKLQFKTPPSPVLDILRTASLAEALVEVLSDKALNQGLPALLDNFGRLPMLTAMLLDSRENIRELAKTELSKPTTSTSKAKLQEAETFKLRFKPLLDTLRPVFEGMPYQVPAPRPAASNGKKAVSAQTKVLQDSDILCSKPYIQLQKERNALIIERNNLESSHSKVSGDLLKQADSVKELQRQLTELQSQIGANIAKGIADALQNRLAPWLVSSESLAQSLSASQSAVQRAEQFLEKQAKHDLRYGTRAQVLTELSHARKLLAAMQTAQQESLRPLPQLAEEIRALAAHIETTEARLNQTSLQPDVPQLRAWAQTLNTVNDLEALQNCKKTLESAMLAEAWGPAICKQAYALYERKAMTIYNVHHLNTKDAPASVTPAQHLSYCLVHARPCRLLIDGHNTLPKLKPLVGASYFKTGQGPTAEARALLIDRVKSLTASHPLLQADIWFDGPDDQHWTETDNLRVWFSGGLGTDRADGRILETLQSEVYRGTQSTRLVVTEDRDLLAQALARGGIGVSPLEMWAMIG